jgi:hypothetical protein
MDGGQSDTSPEPLSEAERAALAGHSLQGDDLRAFLLKCIQFNTERVATAGQTLSESASFFVYTDDETGERVWLTPEEVPPAARRDLGRERRKGRCRTPGLRLPPVQVLDEIDKYGVERFAHILYFPVNVQPWLAGDGAPHKPSHPTHSRALKTRPHARTHARTTQPHPPEPRPLFKPWRSALLGGLARPPLAGLADAATIEALMARDAGQHPTVGPASAGQKKVLVFLFDPASCVARFNYAAQNETVMPEWEDLVAKALGCMLPLLAQLGFAVVIESAVIDKFVNKNFADRLTLEPLETALPEFGDVLLPPPATFARLDWPTGDGTFWSCLVMFTMHPSAYWRRAASRAAARAEVRPCLGRSV